MDNGNLRKSQSVLRNRVAGSFHVWRKLKHADIRKIKFPGTDVKHAAPHCPVKSASSSSTF